MVRAERHPGHSVHTVWAGGEARSCWSCADREPGDGCRQVPQERKQGSHLQGARYAFRCPLCHGL